jgi:hypothetical protein
MDKGVRKHVFESGYIFYLLVAFAAGEAGVLAEGDLGRRFLHGLG